MLANIVNPSAEIREGYEYNLIQTTDGRSLSGFLAEKNDQFVVLRGLDGQNVAIDRKAVVKIEPAGKLWPKVPIGSRVKVQVPQ